MNASPSRPIALAGICLHSTRAGKDLVTPFAPRLLARLHRTFRSNFTSRRNFTSCRSRNLALLTGSLGTAVAIATMVLSIGTPRSGGCFSFLHTTPPPPLAAAKPAPAPALPPKPAKHHRLFAFTANPLRGIASWYGAVLHGHKTASGETFDETEMTACHRSLPFGTLVRVTDTHSQRSVIVRINDRGVLAPDRVIDLSSAAADELGILRAGLAPVKLEILHPHPAPPPNNDTP